jgi:hypothetical protein
MKSITEILGGAQLLLGVSFDLQDSFEEYRATLHLNGPEDQGASLAPFFDGQGPGLRKVPRTLPAHTCRQSQLMSSTLLPHRSTPCATSSPGRMRAGFSIPTSNRCSLLRSWRRLLHRVNSPSIRERDR